MPSRSERLKTFRRTRRGAVLMLVVATLAYGIPAAIAAVSQIDEMTVCYGPSGARGLNPYHGDCRSSEQEVAWEVHGVPTPTTVATTTTRPATTTTQPGGGTLPSSVGPAAPVEFRNAIPDARSYYSGRKVTTTQALQYGWAAGFRSLDDLRKLVAVGLAESGLDAGARNWHPDWGLRPASDVLGVPLNSSNGINGRQVHSDRGAWQISSHWYPQYTDAQTDDPPTAARIVFLIKTQHSDGWNQWDTVDNGAWVSVAPSAATVCAVVPATGC